MMATTETLRGVLRTSRGQPILKLQSAEQRASLALDLLSLGSRAALGVSFLLSVSDRLGFYGNLGERGVSWGTFERFLGYAAKVNAFAPAWMIPFLGTAATMLELLFAGTRTRAAVGGFRQRRPALPIRFSHGDLVWDQVAIRLLCIRCDVLRPISGSRRLKSMDRRLFTGMLHEVEKRAISSTQRLLQPGLARAWLRRTPRGLSVCLYGAQAAALHRAVRKARSRRPLARRCSTFAFGSYPWPPA